MTSNNTVYIKWNNQEIVTPENNARLDWLRNNLNRQDWQFHGPGSMHANTICFQNADDATAFILKFGTSQHT